MFWLRSCPNTQKILIDETGWTFIEFGRTIGRNMVLEKNPKTRHIARKLLQLEDKVKGRPFPGMARVKEISNYSCGPATLEMLLSFVGFKVPQKQLIRSLRAQNTIKLYGINIKEMARAVNAAGKGKLAFWRKHGASVNDIALAIGKWYTPCRTTWF